MKFFRYKLILFSFLSAISFSSLLAQDVAPVAIDYSKPKEYEIGGIDVVGTQFLDSKILVSLSGLRIGDKVKLPGEDISKAIKNLWKQKLFTNVSIDVDRIVEKQIFFTIHLEERPRLSRYNLKGIKNTDADDIRKKLDLRGGSIFTDNMKMNSVQTIKNYYIDKGYLNVNVGVREIKDSILKNSVQVQYFVSKGPLVKIDEINFHGNSEIMERQLKSKLKDTKEKVKFDVGKMLQFKKNFATEPYHPKWYQVFGNISPIRMYEYCSRFANLNFFKASKFKRKDFEDDKKKVIEFYNTKGYRDAKIVSDSVYKSDAKNLVIDIYVSEGHKYYFRNIYWNGNTKYPDSLLSKIVNIKRGEVYNQRALEEKLFSNPNGGDVSSLYMDDGYLFFTIVPMEVKVDGDSIDVELRVNEGQQATIRDVRILGNTKTNEQVIRRELRTLPGNKFSRSDLIRSQREIVSLGYFDPQQLDVVPIPNPENGTVDIEYRVTEKPSDQLELSAGYGGKYTGLTGTLGVSFTNFSLRNIIDKKAWNPLPSGDGQRLSLRVQSGGKTSQFYTVSFTEPWLGGKKPQSLTVAVNHTDLNSYVNGLTEARTGYYRSTGATVALGTRLKKPDDFFTFEAALNYQLYQTNNSSYFTLFPTGTAHNLNLTLNLSRTSTDQILYPKHGSNFSLTASATLPYSLMFPSLKNEDYANDVTKYKLIEFFKIKFKAEWYATLFQNLVFKATVKMGFLGYYNKKIGLSPFERFELGGDGLSSYSILGKEIVRLRGYDVISPTGGTAMYNKYSMELRYPVSLNPSATIFLLLFAEGGNYWTDFKYYRPYDLRKSVGIGIRVFLPMFGLLGVDYGFPLDKIYDSSGNLTTNPKGKAGVILGQEPE